jgi:hypothetical protein
MTKLKNKPKQAVTICANNVQTRQSKAQHRAARQTKIKSKRHVLCESGSHVRFVLACAHRLTSALSQAIYDLH